VVKKPSVKTPAAPFTTSTLQQEAARKLGFSVGQTMSVAQKLYEAGKITYMRTDSVNLAKSAVGAVVESIKSELGDKYVKVRQYKTKSKGAQEAHEAIRPTYPDKSSVTGSAQEQKLYDLIYKRTRASQMSDALIEKTTVNISVKGEEYHFVANGEVVTFDGFLRVYIESSDQEEDEESASFLPAMKENDVVSLKKLESRQRFSQKPARYSEASLVRKLEELGIGRPSTYAPTISTIQNRGYSVKEDRSGTPRPYQYLWLEKGEIKHEEKTEMANAERNKLFPTDIAMVVNDFLVNYFPNVVSYDFTARVEQEFDDIAMGKIEWQKSIDDFYKPFHHQVEETLEKSDRTTGERILGDDPKTGKPLSVRIGRFGPMAQLGSSDDEEKPRYAPLTREQHIETITFEEALKLFDLPRDLGVYEDKKVVVGVGRFGPYVRHDGKFASLKKGIDDPMEIDLPRAIELIEEKKERDNKKTIKTFENDKELQVLNGRWGPYISYKKKNYKIPKDTDAASLSYEDCVKLVEAGDKTKKTKGAKTTSKATKTTKGTSATKKKSSGASKTKGAAKTKGKAKKSE
jgi:DNA topoisomerase-1